MRLRLQGLAVANDWTARASAKDMPDMAWQDGDESDGALAQLQKAVEEQKAILARQAELIKQLRRELRDVQ